MSRCHLVIPDYHAHPEYNNNRALLLGRLINEVKPDTVIDMGDGCDFPSLCSYDKGKKSFQGRTYEKDINSYLDFQDKLWSTVKSTKRRLPLRVRLIGNHEQRIDRAIEVQPELEGVISYKDLDLERNYDIIVPYSGATPGSVELDGVTYAHYLVAGVSGRPISGEHHAYSLLSKKFSSCTVAHSHTFDYCVRTKADGTNIMGLVAGCCVDYFASFAGDANDLWWRGAILCHGVEDGRYDIELISLEKMKRLYK